MKLRNINYTLSLSANTESPELFHSGIIAKWESLLTNQYMKLTSKTKNLVQSGFSLVELLVVIAVIGIIAAIAIPNIANLTGSAEIAKNKRNAQNIVSVASAAIAAGAIGVTNWTTQDAVLTDLATGVSNNTGMTFSMSPLSQAEQDGAKDYFTVTNGRVNYDPTAVATP